MNNKLIIGFFILIQFFVGKVLAADNRPRESS